MSRIKIIITKTTPANATVTVQRGKCDSVTACSPLSGPVQRLKQQAIYANTDEVLGATILDKRQRGTTPNAGYTKPRLEIDTAALCVRSSVCGCGIYLADIKTFAAWSRSTLTKRFDLKRNVS